MASIAEPNLGINYNWLLGETEWKTGMDLNLLKLGALVMPTVLSSNLTVPPASPSDGDMHIIGGTGTGLWSGQDFDIAHWDEIKSIWLFYTPREGWSIKDISSDTYMIFILGTWAREYSRSADSGITADVSAIQGGQPLSSFINEISVCANDGDSLTLPTAQDGLEVIVINNGANSCNVFPAFSDILNGGTVDLSEPLASGSKIRYICYDSTNWISI